MDRRRAGVFKPAPSASFRPIGCRSSHNVNRTVIGYMTIKNNGSAPDRLVGGSVDFASGFQLPSMVMENGVAKMRELNGADIAPGQTVEFKPGGSHVMFVGLQHPLAEGEHHKGTLVFEHAGTAQIEYDVQGLGTQTGPQDMHHMDHMEHMAQ